MAGAGWSRRPSVGCATARRPGSSSWFERQRRGRPGFMNGMASSSCRELPCPNGSTGSGCRLAIADDEWRRCHADPVLPIPRSIPASVGRAARGIGRCRAQRRRHPVVARPGLERGGRATRADSIAAAPGRRSCGWGRTICPRGHGRGRAGATRTHCATARSYFSAVPIWKASARVGSAKISGGTSAPGAPVCTIRCTASEVSLPLRTVSSASK